MSLRDDAILLCGYIYGIGADLTPHIQSAIDRIIETPDEPIFYNATNFKPSSPDHIREVTEKVATDIDVSHKTDHIADEGKKVQTLNTSEEHDQKTPEIEHVEEKEKKHYVKMTDDLVDQAVSMYGAGLSCEKIGKALGPSGATIRTKLLEAGVKMRPSAAEVKKSEKAERDGKDEFRLEDEEPAYRQQSEPLAKPYVPASIDKLTTDHNEFAGKREDRQLVDSDWGDIRYRHSVLNHSNTSIAGDYDVSETTLDVFIRAQKYKEKLALEEAQRGNE